MKCLPIDREEKGSFVISVRVKLEDGEGPPKKYKVEGHTSEAYALSFIAYGVDLANQIDKTENSYFYDIVNTNDYKWPEGFVPEGPKTESDIISRS